MIHVVVIAEGRPAEQVAEIVSASGEAADTISVVASEDVASRLPEAIGRVIVTRIAGFAAAFAAWLSAWDGEGNVLVIRGEATCGDWRGIVAQCRRCHEEIGRLGVWSPLTVPSAWETVVVKPLSATISAVAAVDSAVVSLAPAVAMRLRDLGVSGDTSADDVWTAAVAAAYARKLLVLRDGLVAVGGPSPRMKVYRVAVGLPAPSSRLRMVSGSPRSCHATSGCTSRSSGPSSPVGGIGRRSGSSTCRSTAGSPGAPRRSRFSSGCTRVDPSITSRRPTFSA